MNCSKRHLQYFSSTLFFLLIASLSFGQSNPTKTNEHSSITLKTLRGLFPQYPVAIANEIHGGLHVVSTVDELHGVSGNLKLDPHVLQKGMLVFLPKADSDVTYPMYYYYVGTVTDGVGENGTGTKLDPNGVNLDYWQPFTDLFPDPDEIIPEAVTVVWECTSGYSIAESTGVIDIDGDNLTDNSSSAITAPNAGDHLILMPGASSVASNKTKPIAVYVWYSQWKLISMGTQVMEAPNADWVINEDGILSGTEILNYFFNEGDIIKLGDDISYVYDGDKWIAITEVAEDDLDKVEVKDKKNDDSDIDLKVDPAGNGYPATSYVEGDIVKLIDSYGFVTYAATDSNSSGAADGWLEIARGSFIMVPPNPGDPTLRALPIYTGSYNGTNFSTDKLKVGEKEIVFTSLDAFRLRYNTDAKKGLSITAEETDTGVAIEYPAAWGNLRYSIKFNPDDPEVYELTNGVNITIEPKTIGGVAVDYKRVTIPCGTSTIVVN